MSESADLTRALASGNTHEIQRLIDSGGFASAIGAGGGGNWWETTATGAVTISPSAALPGLSIVGFNASGQLASIFNSDEEYGASISPDGLGIFGRGGGNILTVQGPDPYPNLFLVGPTGAVTISPSSLVGSAAFYVHSPSTAAAIGADTLQAFDADETYGIAVATDGRMDITALGDTGRDALRVFTGATFDEVFAVGPTGVVTISPSDAAVSKLKIIGVEMLDGLALDIYPNAGNSALGYGFDTGLQLFIDATAANALRVKDENGVDMFKVGPTGAVTISPSDPDAVALDITMDATTASGVGLYIHCPANDSATYLNVGQSNNLMAYAWTSGVDAIDIGNNADRIGFFGTTPVTKPTGVAVSAGGIHAALVTLGLIAA